jgi:hypothetical protein
MQRRTQIGKTLILVAVGLVAVTALIVAGCTAGLAGSNPITQITGTPVSVPVTITDAPGDQVVAASLTLNSIVLTDSKGLTASILSSPLTFEAAHLDAVQEPLFTPAIPQDTYTSVYLTYSNAVVDYIDPTTKQLVTGTAALANTSQTITFATPITIGNSQTSLLVDYLVAQSVSISGTTVTVTPTFDVKAVPIPPQPTNGTNGLLPGVQGKVSAVGTNQFTLVDPRGNSTVIAVNSNTQYQGPGFNSFSQLAVGMIVQVDIQIQQNGTLLALRVEEQVPPNALGQLLIGPVTAVTGSPATSFTELTQVHVGPSPTAAPVEKDTITINGSTKFQLPGRFQNIQVGGVPFTPAFDASTMFAGQVVAVATSNLSNNAATADSVTLAPETVGGTITAQSTTAGWTTITLTLNSGSWLAALTGKTSVLVLLPPSPVASTAPNAPAVGSAMRFNGFLFNNNGTLVLVAVAQGPPPGQPI